MQTTLRLCHAAKGWCCIWEQFPQEFGGKCDPLPFMCGVLNSTCIYQLETPKPPDECPSNQRPRQGSGCLSWLLPNRLAVEGCQRQEEERAHSPRTRKASFAGSCKRWSCVWENIEEIQSLCAGERVFTHTLPVLNTSSPGLLAQGTEVWPVLGIPSCSPRKCWQWAALSPASSRACFHMFPLHDYAPHTGWFRSVLWGIPYSEQPPDRSWLEKRKCLLVGWGEEGVEGKG